MKRLPVLLFCLLALVPVLAARAEAVREYAVILDGSPVAARIRTRSELKSAAALNTRARIEQQQRTLRRQLASRNVHVITSVNTLLNAVFVRASAQEAAQLRTMPGVRRVAPLRRLKLHMNKAAGLMNVPQAWNVLKSGGMADPGAGVKIAILDTGIDQEHPAFQVALQSPGAGYPICDQEKGDCAYTNSKVIVARSYVDLLAGDGTDQASATSTPDDYSPRDHIGHGTAAAMVAAGGESTGPLGKVTGVAPKAWLGSYKIFGSPGVNEGTSSAVFVRALEDAYLDGMDIASASIGTAAWFSPEDTGETCSESPGNYCDVLVDVVERASQGDNGMVVTISAGNSGDAGLYSDYPALSTVDTPGIAPSAITVGASANGHEFFPQVSIAGSGVPDNVKKLKAAFGDGPGVFEPLTAPLRDANGLGCDSVPASVSGGIALIQRGVCYFADKMSNAEAAGAVGVVFYCADTQYCEDGGEEPFSPSGLTASRIPAVLVGMTSGKNLKAYAQSHPNANVTIDPELAEYSNPGVNVIAAFSSRGPSIAPETALKPEVVAPGTNVYMATQRYDANGVMYSSSGYTIADGTSFSAPMVAGIAALVKQKNPTFGPAQVKSAIVTTATADVKENGQPANIQAVGAGKANAEAALKANVTVEPATVSFGEITQAMVNSQASRTLKITNASGSAVALAVVPRTTGSAQLQLSAATVAAGATTDVTVSLAGAMPVAGSYEGAITITGGATPLRVPYHFLAGDNVPDNVIPATGTYMEGLVGDLNVVAVRVVDQFGVAVTNAPVSWEADPKGGAFVEAGADAQTAKYGFAGAYVTAGPRPIIQDITATIGGGTALLDFPFTIWPRYQPAIGRDTAGNLGVVNGASFRAKNGSKSALAPGSYISIFGTDLSDFEADYSWYLPYDYLYLPLSLGGVSVSFDVLLARETDTTPAQWLSVPGRISYVGPEQVNVQVPWELQGYSSVQMKVTVADAVSAVYTITLADAAPGVFEFDRDGSGRMWAAAQHTAAVPYTDVLPTKPAKKGEWIAIYANGLGPVNTQPASGELGPASPLATTKSPVSVTIGGKAVKEINFSGLHPDMIGVYQVNARVPDDAPPGTQDLIVTVNGSSSKPSKIAIQ